MKGTVWKACLLGAGLVMVSACSSPTPEVSTTTSSASQLFTLEPTPDRNALQRTAKGYLATLLAEPANEQITLVNANPALISKDTQDLAITLPDGKTAQFHLRDFNTITSGIDGWVGYRPSAWKQKHPSSSSEIDNDPLYYLSIAREGDKLVGRLLIDGQNYRLDYVGPGQHALIKVDESKLPPEGEPLVSPGALARDDTVGKVPQSTHSTIRVLFVTTNQVRASRPNPRLELAQALNDANQYMINSRVDITYELAGYYDAAYDETGRSYNQQLEDMAPAAPLGEGILPVRDSLKADLVSMYSRATQYCGLAYVTSSKTSAHSVISCTESLAHELGHNLGANHNWDDGDPEGNPPYMYGYRLELDGYGFFRTQMSYDCATGCPRIAYHSNPRLLYRNYPMGTLAHHDVARRFNERREVVENFYPREVQYTLYEHANFQGRSCVVTHVRTSSSWPGVQCGDGWDKLVSSARIRGFVPGIRLNFFTQNGGALTFTSTTYSGDLDIPFLDDDISPPAGLTIDRRGENLNDNLYHIASFF
ncbi:zinc-dependent metalloprotease family protein [Pseudomonas sp. JR33AA]|uniref:zinc-dependent metalloprotease family protein n=1 Tax=Pseudomonas sp. JR33AA TaxID=2899113 RepID=UPI001F34B1B0|nr:zinc-dependent metalloprotease family protein [Pseudomonas sp. JR33AA]MCE5978285.1 M12 family metallo-peptidase [Pseudomonas sp. JR33AA]